MRVLCVRDVMTEKGNPVLLLLLPQDHFVTELSIHKRLRRCVSSWVHFAKIQLGIIQFGTDTLLRSRDADRVKSRQTNWTDRPSAGVGARC